jgi:hypothetical protein
MHDLAESFVIFRKSLCALKADVVARTRRRLCLQAEGGTLKTNHLSILVDSFQLAVRRAPPAGQILVHNQIRRASGVLEGTHGFRAWWARPGKRFNLCACGWRADFGEH